MSFWDSSAIIPLLVAEPLTDQVEVWGRTAVPMTVWWATDIECASSLSRLLREGTLGVFEFDDAMARLEALGASCFQIHPSEEIKVTARRLLRIHPLRAADALQLAAAQTWAGWPVQSQAFVTLDRRLGEAARSEGFRVLGLEG